jgi:uncharacterized membrane protein YphA (DoxX/SURF4 family)
MLNIFPDLLAWGLLAPFLLRVVLGGMFFFDGVRALRACMYPKGALQTTTGVLLVIGLFTQIAALAALAFSVHTLWKRRSRTALLACAISLSLLVSGAGAFAFDLPL